MTTEGLWAGPYPIFLFTLSWNLWAVWKMVSHIQQLHTRFALCTCFCAHVLLWCQHQALRGHNWVHFVHRLQCTVILNSNCTILKTWNYFNKRIIWAYSFEEKKKRQVFALFESIFLRNRSLSNTRWFYSKKCKIEKGFLDLNFIQAVIDKYQIFKKLPQISHINKN